MSAINLNRRHLLAAGAASAGLLATPSILRAASEINLYSSRHYDTDETFYTNFTKLTGIGINRIEAKAEELIEISRKAPGFQFMGYSLDSARRPTFRYAFEGIGITDGFVDSPEGLSLRRTLTLGVPGPEGLFLRLAAEEGLTAQESGNRFVISQGLTIAPSVDGTLREANAVKELIIDLSGVESLTIDYTFEVAP